MLYDLCQHARSQLSWMMSLMHFCPAFWRSFQPLANAWLQVISRLVVIMSLERASQSHFFGYREHLECLVSAQFIIRFIKWQVPIHSGIMMVSMVRLRTHLRFVTLCWWLFLGLIRFGIVKHAFADGKSHLVACLHINNNNRAETVLLTFHEACAQHGTPSHVCGDHGTENIKVAEWMEENRGPGQGSYIWGRWDIYWESYWSHLRKLTGVCTTLT